MRWFGHVKRRDENSILKRMMELELEGRRPVGRPKNEEVEDMTGDRPHTTFDPKSWTLGTLNREDDDDLKMFCHRTVSCYIFVKLYFFDPKMMKIYSSLQYIINYKKRLLANNKLLKNQSLT